MGFPEFVIVIASIMALNPFAMDMMLPALPDIAATFHITTANQPQEVLSAFLIGFGIGQFIMGPLSDRFGRRPVLIDGMALYCIASLLAIMAPSFETLLLARVLQGLGTSATRVIATSVVRDCYVGRRMASVMSLAMMIFIAVPVIAPSLGQAVMLWTQWRGIFVVLMVYGVLALIWSAVRMPETLPESERKSLAFYDVLGAFR
jgi:DHA1 family bicyclomycin/chloramphenicol resistance-like MFS transporter